MEPRPGPPCAANEYWLKTLNPSGSDIPNPFAPLYLRCQGPMSQAHGGAASAIVLTPLPPKFLRWHEEPDSGKQVTIPWSKPEATFGLVMGRPRERYMWELAEIKADEADSGFAWVTKEGKEVLVWIDGDEGMRGAFGGWMAMDGVHGHPQLFWIAEGMVDKPLPNHCMRVEIVREWLIPRE